MFWKQTRQKNPVFFVGDIFCFLPSCQLWYHLNSFLFSSKLEIQNGNMFYLSINIICISLVFLWKPRIQNAVFSRRRDVLLQLNRKQEEGRLTMWLKYRYSICICKFLWSWFLFGIIHIYSFVYLCFVVKFIILSWKHIKTRKTSGGSSDKHLKLMPGTVNTLGTPRPIISNEHPEKNQKHMVLYWEAIL